MPNLTFLFMALALFVLLFLSLYFSSINQQPDVGIAFKVPYSAYPELQDIYDAFRDSCVIPNIPQAYFDMREKHELFQKMRNDCKNLLSDEQMYTDFETDHDLRKVTELKAFYDVPVPNSNYTSRLGCFRTDISKDLEQFTVQKIQALCSRLGLSNKINRETDSRGSTYTPPGGFMEYHTNRAHFAGWRFYMHYLPENGESVFVYKHPYDGTFRKVVDTNEGANMFRIRVPPKSLLWHAIYSETHRFSFGLWLDPSLAQHLKQFATRC